MRRAMILAACVVTLAGMASAKETYNLTAGVSRHNGPGGIESYELLVILRDTSLRLGIDNMTLTLESPQGSIYNEVVPIIDSVTASIKGIAPGDVDQVVAGTWTIREEVAGDSNVYQFTLPAMADHAQWGAAPEILSPTNGSVVPPVFEVEVDVPTVSGFSYLANPPTQYLGLDDISRLTDKEGFRISFEETVRIQGTTDLEFWVSTSARLALPVTRFSSTGDGRFTSALTLYNNSPSVNFTVAVPEPSSVVLTLGMGLALLAARRVRANSQRLKFDGLHSHLEEAHGTQAGEAKCEERS